VGGGVAHLPGIVGLCSADVERSDECGVSQCCGGGGAGGWAGGWDFLGQGLGIVRLRGVGGGGLRTPRGWLGGGGVWNAG